MTALRMALLLTLAGLLAGQAMAGKTCVTDDRDRQLCLDRPAKRIISLSPGVTELLFAAGAGGKIVGAVSYSDYPEAARAIPRIGSYKRLDMENLLARQPDLVVAWISGNPMEQVDKLESLGLPVYYSEQRDFEDVATTLERLGQLAGTEDTAAQAAGAFRDGIEAIRQRYADAEPVPVFYQIWDDPLMTVNNDHLISQAGNLCGGVNIFGELSRLTPRVDKGSVLAEDPEAIVAGGMGESNPDWLEAWKDFPQMRAVARDNLLFIPPSSIQRPTPRLLEGSRMLCRQLEQVREHR